MQVASRSPARPLALFTFNLGVEAGQLLFVAAMQVLGAAFHRLAFPEPASCCTAVAYTIGGLATFWVFERCTAIF